MAKRGQCQECCGLLPQVDKRARYCSDACKMRAYRKRKKSVRAVLRPGAGRRARKRTLIAALNGRRIPEGRGRHS